MKWKRSNFQIPTHKTIFSNNLRKSSEQIKEVQANLHGTPTLAERFTCG
jgi:hypothetical protein